MASKLSDLTSVVTLALSLAGPLAVTSCATKSAGDDAVLHESDSPSASSENGLSSINGLSSLNGLTSINGLSSLNGLSSINGLSSLNGLLTTAAGRNTVAYIVKCALPAGRSITKVVSGTTYHFAGALGVAPEWETSACSTDCQETVSACVLAHVNTSGEHIALWLDGDNPALGWGQSSNYPYQEGSFFGNIFIDNPKAYYCNGKDFDMGLVPGRLGVEQGAPYQNPYASGTTYCRDYCTAADAPYSKDGYKSCSGFTHVITVWRNFDPDIDYKVCNRATGKCMDVAGGSTSSGAKVVQNSWADSSHQRWRIAQVSPGKYKFINVKSGKAMEVMQSSTADGADLIQSTYSTARTNQKWSFTPTGDGFYKFSPGTRTSASLNPATDSTKDGALIEQWGWTGDLNQQWKVVPAN